MAQFFDYRVSGGVGGETLIAAWSTKEPCLAVASDNNSVTLFSDEVRRRAAVLAVAALCSMLPASVWLWACVAPWWPCYCATGVTRPRLASVSANAGKVCSPAVLTRLCWLRALRGDTCQGERMYKPISRACAPVALAWRPGTDLLASGWQDGTIQVVSMGNMQPKEDQVVHSSPITCLKWTADGKRLISGDQSGVVGVWKPDGRGRLTPICHYNKMGSVDHVVFVTDSTTQAKGYVGVVVSMAVLVTAVIFGAGLTGVACRVPSWTAPQDGGGEEDRDSRHHLLLLWR